MKKVVCATLCLLLCLCVFGCANEPAGTPGQSGTQPGETEDKLPWTTETPQAPLSYEAYFAQVRQYAEDTISCTASFSQYSLVPEGETLCLKNDGTGQVALKIPGLGGLAVVACDGRWIYGVDGGTELIRLDYFGKNRTVLFTDPSGVLGEYVKGGRCYLAGDALFFVSGSKSDRAIQRLYLPSGRVDCLVDDLGEITLNAPYSNCEITWRELNQEFIATYEALRSSPPAGKAGIYDAEDEAMAMGAVESDYHIYPYIDRYYNAMTQTGRESVAGIYYTSRTPENMQKNGDAWWLDD